MDSVGESILAFVEFRRAKAAAEYLAAVEDRVGEGVAPVLPEVVLVAHNGNVFDFRVLQRELERYSQALPQDWLLLDSLKLVRVLYKGVWRFFCKPSSNSSTCVACAGLSMLSRHNNTQLGGY